EGGVEPARILDRDRAVARAVEDPHREIAQPLRHRRVWIVLALQAADRHRRPPRMQQAAADRHQRGETARLAQRQVPGAVAAHRQSGEVGAVRVAAELARGGFELGDNDVGQLVPLGAFGRLGEHHDRGELRGRGADPRPEADLQLATVVVAAFARAVQEQDHRGLRGRVGARRHEHLVAMGAAVEGEFALHERAGGAGRAIRGAGAGAEHHGRQCDGRQAQGRDHAGLAFTGDPHHTATAAMAAWRGARRVQCSRIAVARPRKLKNPITSVTAVTTTVPATAGSMRMRLSSSGSSTPASAAEQKLSTSAAAITADSAHEPNHSNATAPTSRPISRPLISATRSSFHSRIEALLGPTWPRARPRTIRVSTWTAALPPMPATIGISTARATIFSMVASNWPITAAARNAVSRLMP